MKVKTIAALVFALTLVAQLAVQAENNQQLSTSTPPNAWKTLVPLRSTRADVEKIFGAASEVNGHRYIYKLKTESVWFTYAKGDCNPQDGWNVPAGTILEINVTPQTTLLASDAGFDLSKFVPAKTDDAELAIYTNADYGVTIKTKGSSKAVVGVKYGASSADVPRACP